MTQLPDLRELTSLSELDLSNNRLKFIGDTSFHFLKNLRILDLNDNQIDLLHKGLFQRDIHHKLEEISIEFNNLRLISTHNFVDLEKLHYISLRDNRIERLERRAFMNLDNLRHLSLRGNKLSSISDEAFQNLPALGILDLAYNSLRSFDFDYFDQVGTLKHLLVNVSHNHIMELTDNTSSYSNFREQDPCNDFISGSSIHHSNIKILDLSFNNISRISPGYFKPTELSLISLNLAYNVIMNTSRDIFGNFLRLQILDLSNNFIEYIVPDTFRNSRKIQVLNLAHNELTDIAPDTFRTLGDLRIVDLSFNLLRSIPDSLFIGDDLERLDLSHNQLTKIPVTSLTNVAALTLCELDLSFNHIGAIHSMDLSNKFRRLTKLDLSNNRLARLEDAAFATLPNIAILDLSNNNELEVYGRVFIGLEKNLMDLSLNNISIIQMPDIALPNLRVLSISHNELPSISPEIAANLTSLRDLDLSENDLTTVPLMTHYLPFLRSLSLAGNPITLLSNTSLLGPAKTLEYLDISHLQLVVIENGILNKLRNLRSLRLSTYPGLTDFNIPTILDGVENIRELWIESPASKLVKIVSKEGVETYKNVQETASDLRSELYGTLPRKIRTLTIGGAGFTRLADGIFDAVQASSLHLVLFNTTLSGLPPTMFHRVGRVYNLSIEIDSNNKLFKKIPNPNSAEYPNMPDRILLTDLAIHYTSLSCDCELGWVEYWQRKKRQYFCSYDQWEDEVNVKSEFYKPNNCDTFYHDDDLRLARCSNKNGERLLEILKTELECGWSAGTKQEINIFAFSVFAIVFILAQL
ncbi:CLUMA_CG006599, isoform A [Clunio marinus]|uniref:CLUMA_CG006599, isoform A n=1 Tax=Clunio marinus TaxID=568069 RepID=A0A1J1I3Y9_9DIPT|nr:CLUMA_CG006599, isoform A [Clunio marinus]